MYNTEVCIHNINIMWQILGTDFCSDNVKVTKQFAVKKKKKSAKDRFKRSKVIICNVTVNSYRLKRLTARQH